MPQSETPLIVGLFGTFATAIVSLGVAVYNQVSARKSQRELAQLKERIDDTLAERNALREYQFEARKRLYGEIEPLLFQLAELSESAVGRIQGLARSAAQGNLNPDGSGWLDDEGYYTISTVYRLLAPVAIFQLIQRKLTIVDLSVDSFVADQYKLIKVIYLSYPDHFEFARLSTPFINYSPHDQVSEKKRREDPTRYLLQGIIAGQLDNALEILTIIEPGLERRLRSYGSSGRSARGG